MPSTNKSESELITRETAPEGASQASCVSASKGKMKGKSCPAGELEKCEVTATLNSAKKVGEGHKEAFRKAASELYFSSSLVASIVDNSAIIRLDCRCFASLSRVACLCAGLVPSSTKVI